MPKIEIEVGKDKRFPYEVWENGFCRDVFASYLEARWYAEGLKKWWQK